MLNHELVMKGVALDLRPYIRRDFTAEDIQDFCWDSLGPMSTGEFAEEQYGLPFYMNVCGLPTGPIRWPQVWPIPRADAKISDVETPRLLRKLTQVVDGVTSRYGFVWM